MSIVVFQHVESEDAAMLGRALQGVGHRLRVIELFAGDSVPVDLDDVDGVVSMGGPMNVGDGAAHPWISEELAYLRTAHEAGLPMVGVCLGAQLIAAALGGKVKAMASPEAGWHQVRLGFPGTIDTLLAGTPWRTMQFHLHGQEVGELPPGATPLSGSAACRTQAYKIGQTTYGFQYHFEWDRAQLAEFAKDPLVEKAGTTTHEVELETDANYYMYRHLGDRLCQNLATYLFPIDKRRTMSR